MLTCIPYPPAFQICSSTSTSVRPADRRRCRHARQRHSCAACVPTSLACPCRRPADLHPQEGVLPQVRPHRPDSGERRRLLGPNHATLSADTHTHTHTASCRSCGGPSMPWALSSGPWGRSSLATSVRLGGGGGARSAAVPAQSPPTFLLHLCPVARLPRRPVPRFHWLPGFPAFCGLSQHAARF